MISKRLPFFTRLIQWSLLAFVAVFFFLFALGLVLAGAYTRIRIPFHAGIWNNISSDAESKFHVREKMALHLATSGITENKDRKGIESLLGVPHKVLLEESGKITLVYVIDPSGWGDSRLLVFLRNDSVCAVHFERD